MPVSKNLETAEKYWELYQQGFSFEEVGKSFGVSRQAVWGVLKNHGYPLRKKRQLPFIEYEGKRYVYDDGHYRYTEKGKSIFLHRVVWEQHKGSIPAGYNIYHINGDKSNNSIENLQCLSPKEYKNLYAQQNKACNSKKVRRLDTGEIYESVADAAKKVGIDRAAIARAIERNGKSAGTKWEYI
jgi:predicted DNA-binding protein YlxM (UPF0122 family)